jgi:diguanylate cyclase (GGDEF)-like protein
MPLTGIAIMLVLVAATQLVLDVAERKDDLRQAQIAIAAAGQTAFALTHAPVGLIEGQTAGADEYTLSATLRAKLADQMAVLDRRWRTALGHKVSAAEMRLSAQVVRLYGLIRQRDLRAARALFTNDVSPSADIFDKRLTAAQQQLSADTNGADRRALIAALAVAGAAGALLVTLFLGIAGIRRRLVRAEAEERVLAALATTDSLTGVPNHRALTLAIRTELERARRYQRPFALLFIDIDHFKDVNDRYGHGAGDATLAAFAGIVNDALRSSDSFGRWGGEEFLAVLPETDRGAAFETAERIRTAVADYEFGAMGDGGRLTCSIGLALRGGEGGEVATLIADADEAMYAAKAAGRNRCVIAETVAAALAPES